MSDKPDCLEELERRGSPDGNGFALVAVILAIALAYGAVHYYPAPSTGPSVTAPVSK